MSTLSRRPLTNKAAAVVREPGRDNLSMAVRPLCWRRRAWQLPTVRVQITVVQGIPLQKAVRDHRHHRDHLPRPVAEELGASARSVGA